MNAKAKEREELKEKLKDGLKKCWLVKTMWISGKPTSSGRTDYITIIAVDKDGSFWYFNRLFCKAYGYRLSKSEHIIVSGCGFNKSHHVYLSLMDLMGRNPYDTESRTKKNPIISYE